MGYRPGDQGPKSCSPGDDCRTSDGLAVAWALFSWKIFYSLFFLVVSTLFFKSNKAWVASQETLVLGPEPDLYGAFPLEEELGKV